MNQENVEEINKDCPCPDAKANNDTPPCECNNNQSQCNCKADNSQQEETTTTENDSCTCDEKIKEKDETIKKLEEENKALTDKVKLAQAELINYRRRKDEETTNLLKYANQELIMELIALVDNFERAIKLDDNDLTDEVSKFLSGFKMMYGSLVDTLKKFGVEEINRVGEIFDPTQEQALLTDHIDGMEDDTVIEVLLKGYKLKDRVIRPASVKINQN